MLCVGVDGDDKVRCLLESMLTNVRRLTITQAEDSTCFLLRGFRFSSGTAIHIIVVTERNMEKGCNEIGDCFEHENEFIKMTCHEQIWKEGM